MHSGYRFACKREACIVNAVACANPAAVLIWSRRPRGVEKGGGEPKQSLGRWHKSQALGLVPHHPPRQLGRALLPVDEYLAHAVQDEHAELDKEQIRSSEDAVKPRKSDAVYDHRDLLLALGLRLPLRLPWTAASPVEGWDTCQKEASPAPAQPVPTTCALALSCQYVRPCDPCHPQARALTSYKRYSQMSIDHTMGVSSHCWLTCQA